MPRPLPGHATGEAPGLAPRPPHSIVLPAPTTLAQDAVRIEDEVLGRGRDTDPFVAAVRATRMPVIITDPRLPDNPVVFANDAFCRLTDYTRAEILGRNCRFLQGPDTDPVATARIRAAVRAAEPLVIDIRNHRRGGEAFWNRLLLGPVFDRDGKLTYFYASQVDVTLERERLSGLEHRNAALMAELGDRLRAQRDSEARLRFATEAGRLGVWEMDLHSGEMTVSPICREHFGRAPDTPFDRAVLRAVVHPDDHPRMAEAIAESITNGGDYGLEHRVLRGDGGLGWVELRAQVMRAPDGTALRMVGTSLDITRRKLAEARDRALLRLDDRFRVLDDPAELAFAAAEALGHTLGVSRAGYGTIDIAAEAITIERDWNAPGSRSLAGTLRFRDYGSYIEDLRRGETVVFADAAADARTVAHAGALKAIGALAAINVPVTERGGLVAILYLNQAQAREWSPEELDFVREVAHRTRMAVERRRAEQDLRELAASLEVQVASRTRELMEAEAALRQSQKMEAVGQLTGGLAHDFNNLLTAILGSLELLQARVAQGRTDRLERLATTAQEAAARAAALTHRLLAFSRRQTLAPRPTDVQRLMGGMQELIRSTLGPAVTLRVAEAGALMPRPGEDTGVVPPGLASAAPGEPGQGEPGQGETAREDGVAEDRFAEDRGRDEAARGGAERGDLPPGHPPAAGRPQGEEPPDPSALWPTLVDPGQLENALLNLCINARDAMPGGGALTLGAANCWLDERQARACELAPGAYVALCVQDSGSGMTTEVAAKAFDPFFTTKPLGQGTGLGLSMVYGFVRQSGGQARIDSVPGQGTTVCLYLPRYRGGMAEPAAPAASGSPRRTGPAGTVLVVDDEPSVRLVVGEVLRELGHTVLEAGDGPAGLAQLRAAGTIDLLISDIGLPGGMNGRQVAEAARVLQPGLRVLLITGYAEQAVLGQDRLEPGIEVLTKPFELNVLAQRISAMTEGAAGE